MEKKMQPLEARALVGDVLNKVIATAPKATIISRPDREAQRALFEAKRKKHDVKINTPFAAALKGLKL